MFVDRKLGKQQQMDGDQIGYQGTLHVIIGDERLTPVEWLIL
jgi:hypothetical protein